MNKPTLQPASFGARLVAMFIDNILLSLAIAPILLLIFGQKTLTDAQLEEILQTKGIMGLYMALYTPSEILVSQLLMLALTAFFWIKFAGTPAKRFLGLRVVDAKTGKNITSAQSTLRYVGYLISSFPMFLGFFWVLLDKNNQAWHDKIAGTLVIKDTGQQTLKNDKDSNDKDDTFAA